MRATPVRPRTSNTCSDASSSRARMSPGTRAGSTNGGVPPYFRSASNTPARLPLDLQQRAHAADAVQLHHAHVDLDTRGVALRWAPAAFRAASMIGSASWATSTPTLDPSESGLTTARGAQARERLPRGCRIGDDHALDDVDPMRGEDLLREVLAQTTALASMPQPT